MAEAEAKTDKKGADEAAAPAKKKPPVKLLGIVGAVMVVEAVGVYVVVGALGHKPESAEAKHVEGEHGDHASGEDLVELPLVDDKFQNLSSGSTWLWDCALVIQVKKKNEEYAAGVLKARGAEIKQGVSLIFRKATLNQLKEPGLETLNRQVTAFLSTVIEPDKDKTPRFERVLIPKARGYAMD